MLCVRVQENSQLPAAVLLAQHKDRASQLESQIEKQKQNVKPTNIFSTGIMMVSEHHMYTHVETSHLFMDVGTVFCDNNVLNTHRRSCLY